MIQSFPAIIPSWIRQLGAEHPLEVRSIPQGSADVIYRAAGAKVRSPISKAGKVTSFTKPQLDPGGSALELDLSCKVIFHKNHLR